MPRPMRPELQDLETAPVHFPASAPYDRASMSPAFSLASVPAVHPEPAYIAASAASQIVTSEYQSQHQDWAEDNPSSLVNEIALVAPASLSLINAFLDRLLFNFLASSRSTSLASLRPAVTEVLKPRLAKEAINGADEELQEFLGGGDDEELLDFHNGEERDEDWDLDLVWRRTRLRCMVYTRLGDMEEEDEDMYIEQEHLEDSLTASRLSRDIGIVSPAVAIFLTSILEFIGEHALMIAGEAAYKRCENRNRAERSRGERRRPQTPQRVIVEEMDMEKVALNPTLGRLWRSWRKLIRSPRTSISRILSQENSHHRGLRGFSTSRSTSRKSSVGTADGGLLPLTQEPRAAIAEVPKEPDPATVPLPLSDYDVAEIEVPGYNPRGILRSGEMADTVGRNRRSSTSVVAKSIDQAPGARTLLTESFEARPQPQVVIDPSTGKLRERTRSHSFPTPTRSEFVVSPRSQEAGNATTSSTEFVEDDEITDEHQYLHDDETTPRARGLSRSSELQTVGEGVNNSIAPQIVSPNPSFGSVLNAISKHAARELEVPSGTISEDDSQIEHSDEQDSLGRHKPKDLELGGSSKYLMASLGKAREDAQTRYSASSSVPSPPNGDVSPMEPAFVESGEVSPIDPSEDENDKLLPQHGPPGQAITTNSHGDHVFGPLLGPIRSLPKHSQLGHTPQTQGDSGPASAAEIALFRNIQGGERKEPEVALPPIPGAVPRATHGRQRGTDGPTEDDYQKAEKREAFVVLEDLPALSARNSDASVLSGKDLQPDGTILPKRSRQPEPEGGALPHSPLRKTFGGASNHPGEDMANRGQPLHTTNSTSPSASSRSHAKTPSDESRRSDLRRQLPSVYTGPVGPSLERAGVQRVSPSPREPLTPQGRSSDSSGRDLRSLYAATSGTSPVSLKNKPLVKSNSGDSQRGVLPLRTSTDESKTSVDERYNRGSAQSGDRQRSFEQLINSDQTIQYTLTPQSMRTIEGSGSPRSTTYEPTSKTTQVVNLIRSGRTSSEQPQTLTEGRSAPISAKAVSPGTNAISPGLKGVNGLRANPADGKQIIISEIGPDVSAPSGTSFVIHSGPILKRGPQPIARDARIENETVRDFADFIRSTGPERPKQTRNEPAVRPISESRQTPGTQIAVSPRTSNPTSPTVSRSVGKKTTGLNPIIAPLLSETKAARKAGPRLQARDPTISRSDESSELIDFIRQGPPSGHTNGVHRIPRSVAPFRNTMDSEEISALGTGKSRETNSAASTLDGSFSKSLHSSVNSRTGLLDSSNRQVSRTTPVPQAEKRPIRNEETFQPARKQRRVRDPYAIDDSDEEDEMSRTPRANPKEESLLDFLNSTPPPDFSTTPPPIAYTSQKGKTIQRKNSASVRSRFTRGGSISGNDKVKKSNSVGGPSAQLSTYRTVSDASRTPITPIRENSIRLPVQSNRKPDAYGGGVPVSSSADVERPRNATSRAAARPMQAKPAARDDMDSMRDLADFLKNSQPPEPVRVTNSGGKGYTMEKEEGGGFSKMFSRKKKSAGVA